MKEKSMDIEGNEHQDKVTTKATILSEFEASSSPEISKGGDGEQK